MDHFIQKYAADHFDFHLKVQEDSLLDQIRENIPQNHVFIILDDDPTGTQTVHDVFVYTDWQVGTLKSILKSNEELVFILTNSRALPEVEAAALAKEIGSNLKIAAAGSPRSFTIVSRGDSTLRGHFPVEVDAILKEIDQEGAIRMIIPAFFPGGRYTFGDVHYVKEGKELVPSAETPFAQDKSFAYQNSNLKEWVKEKYKGQISTDKIRSISVEQIRTLQSSELATEINTFPLGTCCIVNALEQADIEHFVYAVQTLERSVFWRTAASLIPVLIGQKPIPIMESHDFQSLQQTGNLIIVGSYVPKTTAQLKFLLDNTDLETVEIDVNQLFGRNPKFYIRAKINYCSDLLAKGRDVLIFTSRDLKFGLNQSENLNIGQTISNALVAMVAGLKVSPKTIIAKGGITSSDIATKALKIKKAKVLGQILPGIPVWEFGQNQKYIVFPGNVGDETALYQAYKKL